MNARLAAGMLFGLVCLPFGCATTPTPSAVESAKWRLADTPLNRTAAQLGNDTAEHLAWAKSLYRQILAVRGKHTLANTLVPYNELRMHLEASSSECSLFARTHPDESVRKAAEKGVSDVSAYATELSLDRRLFEAVASTDLDGADRATKFNVEKILRDFRRAGVDKSDAARARIAQLNEEIVRLGQSFAKNIAGDVREITVDSPAALDGLPQDWIAKHPAGDDGKIHITTKYPDAIPFATYARDPQARLALFKEFKNRGFPNNMEVLNRLLAARNELAQILGYPTWADYITEDKMIGSADATAAFLKRLANAGKKATAKEMDMLLAQKRKEAPDATRVLEWERRYYENLVRSESFAFDSQTVRPYFNFPDVQKGIFKLTGRLFGISYKPVTGLDLWHKDVTAFDVYDGDRHLGRFYLDMHPRPNKYSHAACFGYREGIEGLRLPQAVLVCNFPNPREDANGLALMEHDQVVTFFHEFGHLLHAIFAGHRRWMGNSGISTEWDFVEAPSQMLEEWCYTPETLQIFGKHYKTGEPIPADIVANLKRAAEFGKAIDNAHQLFYSAVSLAYYNQDPASLDTTEALAELQREFSPFDYVDGTHFQCSFGHLDGYSAIYYTYRWSLVIAKAMFDRFQRDGMLNTKTARRYREKVLNPGGSKPAAALVEGFLGAPYSFDPFTEWLGR